MITAINLHKVAVLISLCTNLRTTDVPQGPTTGYNNFYLQTVQMCSEGKISVKTRANKMVDRSSNYSKVGNWYACKVIMFYNVTNVRSPTAHDCSRRQEQNTKMAWIQLLNPGFACNRFNKMLSYHLYV